MRQTKTVHLRVGKSGITDGLLTEIGLQLEKNDPLVVKLLQNFCETHDRKAAAEKIASETKSHIVSLRGGTLILTRKKGRK